MIIPSSSRVWRKGSKKPFIYPLLSISVSYFDVCCVCSRPDSTFTWFMNPFKSLKYMLWNNYKMCLIKFLVIGLLVALMGLFFYSMPVRTPHFDMLHNKRVFFQYISFLSLFQFVGRKSFIWKNCRSFISVVSLDFMRQFLMLVGWFESAYQPALLFSPLPVVDTKKKMCTLDLHCTHRF